MKSIIIIFLFAMSLLRAQVPAISFNNDGQLVIKPMPSSSSHDFDFLVGSHHVHHKKLKSRLTASTEWITFEGSHRQELLLEGNGNLERHWMQTIEGKPVEGMALRLFDPVTRLWSIYWADSNTARLDVPVVGSFEHGVGHFFAKDNFNGKPVILYFRWDATHAEAPVWSQSFSADNGKTWEVNWYMYFSKEHSLRAAQAGDLGVIELRNYLIKPGQRDNFIQYFNKNLIQPQDSMGGPILGRYTIKGDPDRFFWMRGFEDMSSRSRFLNEFYRGPVWKTHRQLSNSLLVNNDLVHLLKPLDGCEGDLTGNKKWFNAERGFVVVDYYWSNTKLPRLIDFFRTRYLPLLRQTGETHVSLWISELRPNDFTALPVFQDKDLLVAIAFYKDEADYRQHLQKAGSLMDDNFKNEMADLVTVKQTLVLIPVP